MTERVSIIGSGAIGKALATFLSIRNTPVELIRARTGTVKDTTEVVVKSVNGTIRRRIPTRSLSEVKTLDGIVVVSTKAFSNSELALKLQKCSGEFSIVVMQNGLNVERPFDLFPNVYRAVLFSTSQVMDDGTVSFKAVRPSPLGVIRDSRRNAKAIAAFLSTPEFEFEATDDIQRVVWEKTIANCAFNSICPILETDNGIFHRNPSALHIAQRVILECQALATAMGVVLDSDTIQSRLLQISERSAGQLISTYEDLRNRRPTEIDSLNLEMERLAISIGRPELVVLTASLGRLIAIKSDLLLGNKNEVRTPNK